jgi:hypothetical protein
MRLVAGIAIIAYGLGEFGGGPATVPAILAGLGIIAGILLVAGLWTPISGALVAVFGC